MRLFHRYALSAGFIMISLSTLAKSQGTGDLGKIVAVQQAQITQLSSEKAWFKAAGRMEQQEFRKYLDFPFENTEGRSDAMSSDGLSWVTPKTGLYRISYIVEFFSRSQMSSTQSIVLRKNGQNTNLSTPTYGFDRVNNTDYRRVTSGSGILNLKKGDAISLSSLTNGTLVTVSLRDFSIHEID